MSKIPFSGAALAVGMVILVATPLVGTGLTYRYSANFSSASERDQAHTSATWDTAQGTVHLAAAAFDPDYQVAVNRAGEVITLWDNAVDSSTREVQIDFRNPLGEIKWSRSWRYVQSSHPTGRLYGVASPARLALSEDTVYITWAEAAADSTKPNSTIRVQGYKFDGQSRWSLPVAIGDASQRLYRLYPSITVTGASILVAWAQIDPTVGERWISDIMLAELNLEGKPRWVGGSKVSAIADRPTLRYRPEITTGPVSANEPLPVNARWSDRVFVAWAEARFEEGGTVSNSAHGQELTSAPSRGWVNDMIRTIDGNPALPYSASLHANPNGDIFFVWSADQYRSGENTAVLYEFFQVGGGKVWENQQPVKIADPSRKTYQIAGRLATGSGRAPVVAWLTTLPTNPDASAGILSGQQFDPVGGVVWAGNGITTSATAQFVQRKPSIFFDPAGRLWWSWIERASGGATTLNLQQRDLATGRLLQTLSFNQARWQNFGIAQSNAINPPSDQAITAATFSWQADKPSGTTLAMAASNDNGLTWEPVDSGVRHTFTSRGSSLKWRATLGSTTPMVTPVLRALEISYDLTRDSSLDTDRDGLSDTAERTRHGTNPFNADSDGDGYLDGIEVANGYNPLGPGKLTQAYFAYFKPRLGDLFQERALAVELRDRVRSINSRPTYVLKGRSGQTLINAYIYGGYSAQEIAHTVRYGVGAVHPTIPAELWRTSQQYAQAMSRHPLPR